MINKWWNGETLQSHKLWTLQHLWAPLYSNYAQESTAKCTQYLLAVKFSRISIIVHTKTSAVKLPRRSRQFKAYSAVETALRQDARMNKCITESEPETLDGHSWVPNGNSVIYMRLVPYHLFHLVPICITANPNWHNFKGARPSMNRNPMWIIAMA